MIKSEFLDRRFREVAIDGFDPRANNPRLYLFGFLGFLVFTIVCAGWLIAMINAQQSYSVKLVECIVVGII